MNYLNYSIVVVLGVIEASAGNFTHEMPQATNEKPLDTPYAELAETFRNPFGKVQTGCYWYWYRGNVSVEGVRKDLAAMKRAGIDRAFIGDIGAMGKPRSTGPVEIFSPEWEKAVATAFEEATRLGIEIGLFNGPGWSMAGGPWVKPEQAMRRFVSSETIVEGPAKNVKLVQHDRMKSEKYHDLLAIAYPVTDSFGASLKNKTDSVRLAGPTNAPSVVELTAADAFAAQSVKVTMRSGAFVGRIAVEAEDGGKWRTLCDERFSQYFHAAGTTFSSLEPLVAVFEPVSAKRFRVTITPERSTKNVVFKSVEICAAPLVEQFNRKSLARMHEMPTPLWTDYKWRRQPADAKGTALDPAKSVKLYGKVAKDGTLDWDVPAGKWVIYRFGVAPTPAKNGPAFGIATGHEVDKMNAAHVGFHFDSYIAKLLALVPPEKRKSVRYAVMDSWEQGSQNCTDDFAERFKAAFGYDPTPYLPALFGTAVADRETSDRFLWDVRRFVADETAYSFVGGLRRKSNANGMRTWLENYGHWGFPGEFLQYGGQSDEVSGEFWSEGDLGIVENRAASSCAHTYGKHLAWAESFTSSRREFARAPMDLKLRADRFFAEGLNATILHVYLHQPDERKPGINAWFGTEFNRHNTWFDHLDLFTGYLKRCGWMLRQGLNVADIAYFIGEDAPCMEGDIYSVPPPAGRQYDFINAEVLEETATVDDKGRIVLPHGTAYEVLVLPKLETMRPKMVECIERLVNAGAFVLGPKPKRSPSLSGQPQSDAKVKEIADRLWGEEECKDECKVESVKCKVRKYGKGVIASDISLDEALKMRGSEPDVILHSTLYTLHSSLAYAHRTMPNAEIYFISNQGGEAIPSVEVSFRVSGRTPELWDAAMGTRRAAEKWSKDGKRSAVTLSLAKNESVFVVFPAEKGNGEWGTGNRLNPGNPVNPVKDNLCVGPWTVSFESDALHRGPKEPIVLDKLIDLSTSSDPAIKFYSGRITYKTKFTVPRLVLRSLGEGVSLPLSLGDVAATAKVKVNGKYAGGVCFAPYRLDIAPFVKGGENELEIEVCNLWVNRLVGDDGMENRPTWTYKACCDKKTKLPKSGLIGPVRIGADVGETPKNKSAVETEAKPALATPFADNMVLQRGMKVPVWGTAEPDEKVTVSFAGQTKGATADAKGAWSVDLDAMAASKEGRTLRVTGAGGAVEIRNVLVGEVWFASGQSNMECPIWGGVTRYRDGKGAMMIAMTRRPHIRFAKNPRKWSVAPLFGWKSEWRDFSPESFDAVKNNSLSAVAFYYALELYGALDVPIGIVDSSWGGTNIDAWTPRSAYATHTELADVAAFPVTAKWDDSMKKSPVSGANQQPSVLWNGMVAAWAPMAIRGMIWYQGCHNAGEPQRYCSKMHALYDGWSKEFRNPFLKLYFVQLAPCKNSWFNLQMAQAKFAAEEPNAALVTTCDVGNSWDIHPNDKEPVARRLALHALKRDYGFDNIIDDAPTVKSWKVEGGKFVLTFENAQSLYCYNADRSEPKGFEVAGDDGKFFPAKVLNENANSSIKGAELIVGADEVPEPKQLRYLYSKPWIGSLYSADSALPLGPFELKGENER